MSEHELWNELGNLYFMSGAYNQAIYAYHRSIQLDGSFGRPYSNLALTYVQQGKYQEAIELYRSSIELLADNKEKAISWSRLGNVYRHLKDYTKAVVAYQEADALDPQSTPDSLPQNVTDVLPPITADNTPQSAADLPEQTAADILPQSEEIVQPESMDEMPESIEVPSQTEEITDVDEGSGLLEPAIQDDSAVTEIPASAMEALIEATPISSEEPGAVAESLEEILMEASLDSAPSDELARPSEEESLPDAAAETDQIALDDSTASWALAELPHYQEDISESPETASLTIWGEPEFADEDWDLFPAPDPEPVVELPENGGDGLTRWTPIPEEEPGEELEAIEQVEDIREEMSEPEPYCQASETVNYPQSSTEALPQNSAEVLPQEQTEVPEQPGTSFPLALPARSSAYRSEEYSEPTPQLVEVEVEERPAANTSSQYIPQFVLAEEPMNQALDAHIENAVPLSDLKRVGREAQEMQGLEASIAKFKRAVQVNPHNAYAWDALGTLYKSAGLYDDAILAYQQATSINPPKALYYPQFGIGLCLPGSR